MPNTPIPLLRELNVNVVPLVATTSAPEMGRVLVMSVTVPVMSELSVTPQAANLNAPMPVLHAFDELVR